MRSTMRGGWRTMSNVSLGRLKEAMDAHVMHVYPKELVRALDHSDRHGTPILHEQPRGKALATLRNAKNQRFLWQEAAQLNATKQSNIVIDVLYNELFKKIEQSKHVLARTKSLFLQQTLLAGISTEEPSIALVALQKLAALDTTLIPQTIRNQCVEAVVRLAVEKDTALLIDVVPLVKQFNVTVDEHVAAALLDELFHHNDSMALLAFASSLPTALVLPLSTQCQIFVSMLRQGIAYAEVNAKYLEIHAEFDEVSDDNVLGFLLSRACMEGAHDVIIDVLECMEKYAIPLSTEDALSLYHALLVPHGTKFYENAPILVDEQCIVDLFNTFPKALPAATTELSLAISAASFLNQHQVTTALFTFAKEKNISILDVSYGHAGATASSNDRQRFNSFYKTNHKEGKVVITQQWNVQDPGYHFSGSLLQFMCKLDAKDNVLLLLKEMQYYHVEASESDMKHVLDCLTFCPSPVKPMYNLYQEFPHVIKNAPIALTQGIVSLLSEKSKFEEAMQLYRCFVWTEAILLDHSIFSELIYAATKNKMASTIIDEITTQATQRGKTLSQLHSQVILLCQKHGDVATMSEMLLTRPVDLPPLSDDDIQAVIATLQSSPLPFFKRLPKRVINWKNPTFLSLTLIASLETRQLVDCLELMGMAIDNAIELSPESCLACSKALEDKSLDAQFAGDLKLSMAALWERSVDSRVLQILGQL
ncbi:hypothetical protein THRCLA_08302 [Thraustotheca clavata]|uniref:Uncharacterized protein n=1 Tax=Thraustotheca clavata TaxID=74557 RepID=A0A1V9Z7K5_9STRA|nr:hypothetical protein THRCLA_08302 [Thraustotheca clavata]